MTSQKLRLLTAMTMLVAMSATGAFAATHYKVLYNFNYPNGGGFAPEASLVFDSGGNLYGTAVAGGLGCTHPGCGVAFRLAPNADGTWTESVLHGFNGSDGSAPVSPLVFDSRGDLYGSAAGGGSSGNGTTFELMPRTNGGYTAVVLQSFTGLDGGQPYGGVTLDNAGRIYGTTSSGGSYSGGVAFTIGGGTRSGTGLLHSFGGSADGRESYSPLTADAGGNLYGTTCEGGDFGSGTVFKLVHDPISGNWRESVLHSFTGADGASPHAGVVFDAGGNLYGTTYGGGAYGVGTVFKLSPNSDGSWRETVLHSFTGGNDGGSVYGGVVFDHAGNLYGATNSGGPGRHGTVFKLTPTPSGQWVETVLHGFTGQLDGGWPVGGVILDSAGNVYGTTVMGGTGGIEEGGVVFEITP